MSGQTRSPEDDTKPEFRGAVEVRIGTINVVVLDSENHPVTGLTPNDFSLFVDGRRREITNFAEVRGDTAIVDAERPRAPPEELIEAHPTSQVIEIQPRLLVVVVDNDNISAFNRNHLLKQAQQFIEGSVGASCLGMVLTNEKYPRLICPPTTDASEVVDSVRGLMKSASGAGMTQNAIRFAEDRIYEARRGAIARESAISLVRNTARQIDDSLKRSVDTLKTVCRALGGFEGSKDVLYVSDGLPMIAGEELFRLAFMLYGDQRILAELNEYYRAPLFEQVANQAVAADVTIHTIDARGLLTGHDSPAERRRQVPASIGHVKASNYQEPLLYLAAQTGGVAVVNTNDFTDGLARVEDAITRYYSIGFPLGPQGEDTLHSVRIDLPGHPEHRVRYRRQFLDRSAASRSADRTMTGLLVEPRHNALGVEARIDKVRMTSMKKWVAELAVNMPISNLFATPTARESTADLSIFTVVVGKKGRSPLTRTRSSVSFVSDRGPTLELQIDVALDSGFNRISIGVLDEGSGLDGYAALETTPDES